VGNDRSELNIIKYTGKLGAGRSRSSHSSSGFTGWLSLSMPTEQQSYTKSWLMQRCCRENVTVSTINDNEPRFTQQSVDSKWRKRSASLRDLNLRKN
jgi:hypothetical protein